MRIKLIILIFYNVSDYIIPKENKMTFKHTLIPVKFATDLNSLATDNDNLFSW